MGLDHLLQERTDVWRGGALSPPAPACIPTGFTRLDTALGGGWPQGGLVDILSDQAGVIGLVMPVLATLSQQGRWLAWVDPPYIPYAPALAHQGVVLSRMLVIRPPDAQSGLWALEQSLNSGACGAVLAWSGNLSLPGLRRLQLAASDNEALALLFRPAALAEQAAPAVVRLGVKTIEQGLDVRILKRRGGGFHPSQQLII